MKSLLDIGAFGRALLGRFDGLCRRADFPPVGSRTVTNSRSTRYFEIKSFLRQAAKPAVTFEMRECLAQPRYISGLQAAETKSMYVDSVLTKVL